MDIAKIPFSCRGSYMAISYCEENGWGHPHPAGLYLRTVSGGAPYPLVFRFQPTSGMQPVDYSTEYDGAVLKLIFPQGTISFCFVDAQTILCVGKGRDIGLHLDEISMIDCCNYIHPIVPGDRRLVCVNCYKNHTRHLLFCRQGSLSFTQKWIREEAQDCQVDIQACEEEFSFFIRDAFADIDLNFPDLSFAQAEAEIRRKLSAFAPLPAHCDEQYKRTALDAAYVQWSSLVAPRGNLRREGMLMSKNWMTSVWAWDHCFNAIALCYSDPKLAWDQFMLLFDYQQPSGLIPDFVNDAICFYNCVKLPVHGWTFRRMMRIVPFTSAQLREAYEKLSGWTNWWLICRDMDHDGLCEYWHGNDSCWDNSTVFDQAPCVVSPELSAFLVVQMDVLSELAEKLNEQDAADSWKKRALSLSKTMADNLFRENLPVPISVETRLPIKSSSLLPYLSLIAGEYLPAAYREKMLKMLQDDHYLTSFGYASEMPASPLFEEDGYWRGAVWAPVMMILSDAVNSCGHHALAGKIAATFCETARSFGFAENYSALTGKGLRDQSYTWSASIFLIFLREYLS